MTFFIKTVVTAALSVVTAASLNAQTVPINAGNTLSVNDPTSTRRVDMRFLGGYGGVEFNVGNYDGVRASRLGGAVGALNVINGGARLNSPQGILGASVVTHTVKDGPREQVFDAISWQSPSVNTMTLQSTGDNAGQVLELGLKGGLSMSSSQYASVATGGNVEISNIRVDLSNKWLVADLAGTRNAINTQGSPDYQPAESFSRPSTVLWTFASVDGPTRLNPATIAKDNPVAALQTEGFTVVGTVEPSPTSVMSTIFRSDLTLNDLMLTPEASLFMSDAWGLQETGQTALNIVNGLSGAWGDMRVGAFFQTGNNITDLPASIPEPSTYMLMGLGLLGVWAVSRQSARRHQPV